MHLDLAIGARRVTLTNVMTLAHRYLKPVVTAIAVAIACSVAARAQDADSSDEAALLAALAGTDPAVALRAERQLQALWRRSGSTSMDMLLKRGRDAMERGDTPAAIEHLTALTDHAPDFAEGWHARASAYFHAGLIGPAIADLGRALTLNPNNYEAILGLGAILETVGDAARAHAAYARAKAIHPYHEEVTKALERLEPQVRGTAL